MSPSCLNSSRQQKKGLDSKYLYLKTVVDSFPGMGDDTIYIERVHKNTVTYFLL